MGRIGRSDLQTAALLPLLPLAMLLAGSGSASTGRIAVRSAAAQALTRTAPAGVPTSAAVAPGGAGLSAAAPSAAGPAAAPSTAAHGPAPAGEALTAPVPPQDIATQLPAGPPGPEPQRASFGVSFHRQQDPDWCDPADLQMWMEALGVALPGSNDHDIQQAIWDYELSHNDGYRLEQWNASPYAVAAAFTHFSSQAAGDPAAASADEAGVILSRSLALDHQPAIVMVGHGSHYILVTGVTLGPAGADAPPSEVTVVDPLAQGDNPIDATSGGTSTYGWEQFTSELFTVVQNRPGPWEDHWIVVAAGESTVW